MRPATASGAASASRRPSFPGFHLHLRHLATGLLPDPPEIPPRPHDGKAQGDQGGGVATNAPVDPGTGALAEAGRHRLLRLPRGADQHRGTQSLPVPCRQPMGACAPAPQSKGRNDVEADPENSRRVSPQAQDPSSLAKPALRRQTPEVGAECPNGARSDLCGGMPAMAFPTAMVAQAAAANGTGWTSLAGIAGYQVVNRSRSVPSRVRVRVCTSR